MKVKPNKSDILKKIAVFFAVLISTVLYAQTYPVQVTPQLIPPYSLKIADYATTTSEKLYTNILLTDVNEVGRRIRLKMYIEGQGLSITTRDVIIGETPIYVDGGINLRLSNLDLQAYFQLNNLVGITPQQYNAPLPNGGYDFCFEVYDYFTNRKLSTKSCTTVYLLQNDPPILNTPFKNDIVNANNPQNLLFTWTPRHSNVSNVQYEFTLKELWDAQNPQANFLASVPFYQTNTYTTTLLVGPEAPQLLSGKIYGWQVRAFVSDGVSETSVFKNDGKSEIFWFKYLENCRAPSFVISQALTAESVQVNWQSSAHVRYKIQYRKKGFGDDDWFEVHSYTNEGKIRNLEPATVYEFRVGGECTQLSGFAYSNIQEFTTPSNDEAAYYNCGLTPQINITNKDPLPKLGINETFTAGDFPVITREVNGSNGTFSGWGYITLPFLENLKEMIDAANIATGGEVNIGKYTRIKVVFNNVQVNSSYELVDGVVETEYDPNWKNILDLDEVINDIVGDNGAIKGFDATNTDIKDVTVDENGNVVIIPEEGDPIPVETQKPVTFTDKNGDQWTVKEDGTVTKGKAAEGGAPGKDNTEGVSNTGNIKQISSKDVLVTFEPSGYYGTDFYQKEIQSDKYKSEYEFIKKNDDSEYSVLYKLISDLPKHKTDIVKATVKFSNGKTKDDIVFKTKEGTAIDTKWSENEVTLSLTNRFEFVKEEILATVKPKDSTEKYTIAGKLNVWHAQQRSINLTLVSVDEASTAGVGARINEIYNKAGIHFNISTESIHLGLSTLNVGDSDMLSHYTDDEKKVISAFKDGKNIANNQYYIFFFKDGVAANLNGFMPLKRQFGFVFTEQDAGRIAAHELGHGIFGLKHPFDQYNAEEARNENHYLMSYGNGTAFSHMDWQKLHAPGIQLYWFQGDEAGQYTYYKLDYVCVPVEYQNRNHTYFDLDGNPIILGEGYAPAAFVGSYTPDAEGRISVVRETSSGDLYYPIAGQNKKYYWKYKDGAWQKDKYGKKIKFDKFSDGNRANARLVSVNKTNKVLLNGQETGEVFEEARNCPIRPKSSSSSEENIRCVQMNHTKSVNNEIVATVKSGLSKALNSIDIAKTQKERSLGSFSHIFQINNGASVSLNNSEKEWDLLEDKLHLLSYHKPNTYFVVGLLRTENNNLYTSSQLREIATQAMEGQSNGKNIVLVLVNGSVFESLFGETTTVCSEMGFAQSSTDIVDENLVTNSGGNLADLLSIYASIEKPLILNKYFQYADGALQNYLYQSNKNIRGYSFINHLSFYQSVAFKEYQQMRFTCINNKSFCETDCDDADSAYNCDECEPNYNSCLEKGITYVARELEKEYAQGALANTSLWSEVDINKIARFREIYMDYDGSQGNSDSAISINTQENYTFMLWQETANTWTWWSNLQIASGLGTELVDDVHFYDFNKMAVVDNLVLGAVDVAGLIPGVDTFADPIGAIYAGARGDYENATMYAASFAIPFAGAAYIKGGKAATKQIDEMYGIVARQANNTDGFILESKRLSEIATDEFHVSSVLHSGDKKLIDKAVIDTKQYTDANFVRSQVDELATAVNNLWSKIDNLPNLSLAERNALKADINASSELKNLFVKNIDNVDELADAWKNIGKYHSELKTNPASLQAFVALKKNPSFDKMGLTDDIIGGLQGAEGLSYKDVLQNLDNFGKKVDEKNIALENFGSLLSEIKESPNKSDGANWIVKYLGDNAGDFSGKKIKFEEYISNDLGGRFIDVTDVTSQTKKIFYEFKSVKSVPSGHFNEQFMKDLTNANSLDQIKWIFNGAKNPPNFKENMIKAIDNLPLTDDLATKFLKGIDNPTPKMLKKHLKDNFDNIFKLAN